MQLISDSIFLRNDQPTTCPKCGCRTDIVFDFPETPTQIQIHQCLDNSCKTVFVEEDDDNFNETEKN